MLVSKCMQIQIAFRQYDKINLPRKFRSLEVKLHVNIFFFFIEIAFLDFNDFHIRM